MYNFVNRGVMGLPLTHLRDIAQSLGAYTPSAASAMTPNGLTQLSVAPVFTDLPGPWLWMTFMSLLPSQQVVAHADQPLQAGYLRYHLPIETNGGCWSFSDGVWQQLEVGRVYTMRPDLPHGAVNWGAYVRIHLIIDAPAEPA